MTARQPTKMVVLDFSGTLSLEATLYGSEENLIRELKRSGLWRLGVDSLDLFWNEIVNPTWTEGSTTATGYKRLIFERVRQISEPRTPEPAADEIWTCASNFVDSYFEHSPIDPEWKAVLQSVLAQPDVLIVVATDHYAEATGHILEQLKSLAIEGAPALQAEGRFQVLVANSADLGHHKADRAFWERLKRANGLKTMSKIVILDDFGFNEQQFDRYADRAKVAARLNKTVELLSTVFEAPAQAFPFFLKSQAGPEPEDQAGLESKYRDLISRAGRFAGKVLAEGG